MGNRRLAVIAFLGILAVILSGCGIWDEHNEDLAKDESFYDTGASVKAVDFSEAQQITLFVWKQVDDGKSKFVKVANGDVFKPGKHKFGIDVDQRRVNGDIIP